MAEIPEGYAFGFKFKNEFFPDLGVALPAVNQYNRAFFGLHSMFFDLRKEKNI
jgi:hypothetical protein